MKQTRIFFLTALCFLAACVKLQEPDTEPVKNTDDPQGEVEITFSVERPGDLIPATKTLTDTPTLNNMWVAVFGSSGYLKEYREATLVTSATTNYWVPDTEKGETEDDRPSNTSSNTYQYRVTLSLSENSRRILHFIANAPTELPFDQATTILPELLSSEGDAAYWQTITLDEGIKAKRDSDGDFIDAQGHKITGRDPNQRYVVSDETQAALNSIALIRNFAKIEVYNQNDSNFELISFAAINVPTSGSIVPYFAGGFVQGYQNNSYEQLRSLGYPGFLPLHAEFNDDIPAKNDFVNGTSAVAGTGQAFYLYERPVPNDRQGPTFVIIYGKYTDPKDHAESLGFYRVDLMEGQEYYPIYRNFKYQISIKKILKPGASTPEEAAVTAGSADVSADVATASLADISDGMSRIVVSYMSKTLTRQYNSDNKLELKFKFYPDVTDFADDNDAEPKHDNSKVTVTRETENGPIIITRTVDTNDSDDGWRSVWITTSAPSDVIKTERLKVEGTVIDEDNHQRKLYRYITYSMISTQTMYVHCSPKRVQKEVGESVDVDITIPSGLPESIFPLIFQIEAASLSLTPDTEASNNNLPVISSTTTVPGGSGLSFHFERSLSYSEYLDLPAVSGETAYALPNGVSWDGLVTLTCHFKTNKKLNGSQVYVSEKAGYFHQANDGFSNYGVKDFTNLAFSYGSPTQSGVPALQGESVTFSFDIVVDAGDGLPNPVYVELVRLRPTQGSGLTAVPGRPGVYSFTPTDSHCALQLYTSEAGGVVTAKLSAEEYNDKSISTDKLTFQNAQITNKVLYGIGKQAVFQYTYENEALLPVIVTLTGLTPVSTDNRFADNGNGTWTFTPHGGNATQSFTLETTTENGDVSVHIENVLYSNAPTVEKGREYMTYTTPGAFGEKALGVGTQVEYTFSYDADDTDHDPVTFAMSSSNLTTTDSRMVNNNDGTWTFTPNDNNQQQTITFTTTTFARSGNLSISSTGVGYSSTSPDSYTRPTTIVIPEDYLRLQGGNWNDEWYSTVFEANVYSDKSCNNSISGGFLRNSNERNNAQITINIQSTWEASTPAYMMFHKRIVYGIGGHTYYYATTSIGALLNASLARDNETITFSTTAP